MAHTSSRSSSSSNTRSRSEVRTGDKERKKRSPSRDQHSPNQSTVAAPQSTTQPEGKGKASSLPPPVPAPAPIPAPLPKPVLDLTAGQPVEHRISGAAKGTLHPLDTSHLSDDEFVQWIKGLHWGRHQDGARTSEKTRTVQKLGIFICLLLPLVLDDLRWNYTS